MPGDRPGCLWMMSILNEFTVKDKQYTVIDNLELVIRDLKIVFILLC